MDRPVCAKSKMDTTIMRISREILRVLQSPAAVMLGILSGFLIAFRYEAVSGTLAPFGKMYLAFLNMCILPIIITSIISGPAKMIRTPETSKRLPAIIIGFAVLLFVPSIAGTLAALAG